MQIQRCPATVMRRATHRAYRLRASLDATCAYALFGERRLCGLAVQGNARDISKASKSECPPMLTLHILSICEVQMFRYSLVSKVIRDRLFGQTNTENCWGKFWLYVATATIAPFVVGHDLRVDRAQGRSSICPSSCYLV